jgi:hypothetical protein
MHLLDMGTNQILPWQVYEIIPYVSSDPAHNGSDAVIASGNPAIVGVSNCGNPVAPGCISIRNETCAQLFVRVVVRGTPVDAGAIQDSGSEAGEAGDAATE